MTNNVGNAFTNPSIISYCTGLLRGIEHGVERVVGPINVVAYVEIEAFAVANLVAQMESGVLAPRPIWSNIKTFPAQYFHGKVHGFTGGYPCPPFSHAGLRLGTEDPRHLWPFLEWQMSAIRPVWGFFENVAGHLSLGFDTVYRSLRRMGYRVEAGIYTAEEAGAPHERERLFILAVADSYFNGYGASTSGTCDTGSENEGAPQGKDRQWLRTDFGNGSSNVANPESIGEREQADKAHSKPAEWGTWNESFNSSEHVADSQSFRIIQGGEEYKSEQSDQDGIQRRDRQSLAFGVGQGLERPGNRNISTGEEHPMFASRCNYEFPAGPGSPPHEWEAPRVIESGMGCSAHGYNFREDLLRGLGNGVVEQTSEIAFRDLLRKHGLLNH